MKYKVQQKSHCARNCLSYHLKYFIEKNFYVVLNFTFHQSWISEKILKLLESSKYLLWILIFMLLYTWFFYSILEIIHPSSKQFITTQAKVVIKLSRSYILSITLLKYKIRAKN